MIGDRKITMLNGNPYDCFIIKEVEYQKSTALKGSLPTHLNGYLVELLDYFGVSKNQQIVVPKSSIFEYIERY